MVTSTFVTSSFLTLPLSSLSSSSFNLSWGKHIWILKWSHHFSLSPYPHHPFPYTLLFYFRRRYYHHSLISMDLDRITELYPHHPFSSCTLYGGADCNAIVEYCQDRITYLYHFCLHHPISSLFTPSIYIFHESQHASLSPFPHHLFLICTYFKEKMVTPKFDTTRK